MKKTLIIAVLLAVVCSRVTGQIELKDLKAPDTPGLILLDKAPTSVDRPTTPAGIATSILSLKNGGAVEVAPYWLKAHPNLSYDKFSSARSGRLLAYTTSISVATVKGKGDTTYLGLGLKTQLFRWRNKNNQAALDGKRDLIRAELNEDTPDAGKLSTLKKDFMQLQDAPTLLVSFAVAYAGVTTNAEYKHLQNSRFGAWTTIQYATPAVPYCRLILLGRYLNNPGFEGYTKDSEVMDAGGSLLYKRNNFGVSAEFVQRKNISKSQDYSRASATLEYRLIENCYITGTAGKNFDEKSDLFLLFGVNIGLSAVSVVK